MAAKKDRKISNVLTTQKKKKDGRDDTPAVLRHAFRAANGRFTSYEFFAVQLERGLVKYAYADGSRIRMRKDLFITVALQTSAQKKEKARMRTKYEKQKREKKTGKKIIKPEKPPKTEIISAEGEAEEEPQRIPKKIQTYVRYGYTTKDINGAYGEDGRGACVLDGKIPLKEALNYTNPQPFYWGWEQVRADVLDGLLFFQPGSGIHYYHQYRDKYGFLKTVPGSEIRIDGDDMLSIGE